MATEAHEVPYGRANAASAGPLVRVCAGAPLRLSDGPYPFDEPPDLVRVVGVGERMELLREHLKSLCGPWDKLSRSFLDAYFAGIAAAIHAASDELRALALRTGDLFVPADWSFAAFRPLPQAHLADGAARAEIAFWTGARFVAIVVEGGNSPSREERLARERLVGADVELVRVPARALVSGPLDLNLLPEGFARFWEDVLWPASPFGPTALSEL